MNHYNHLTTNERENLRFVLAKGYSIRKIANLLCYSLSQYPVSYIAILESSKYTSLAWTDSPVVGSLLLWIWFCRIETVLSLFLSLCT